MAKPPAERPDWDKFKTLRLPTELDKLRQATGVSAWVWIPAEFIAIALALLVWWWVVFFWIGGVSDLLVASVWSNISSGSDLYQRLADGREVLMPNAGWLLFKSGLVILMIIWMVCSLIYGAWALSKILRWIFFRSIAEVAWAWEARRLRKFNEKTRP